MDNSMKWSSTEKANLKECYDLALQFEKMDIAKDVDGHMVAIPKKHVKSILDCETETLSYLMAAVKKVSNHCIDHCGYDGVNLLNASDESAGQSVPHFHIHIIPRKTGDGIDAWPKFIGTNHEIETLFQKLRMD